MSSPLIQAFRKFLESWKPEKEYAITVESQTSLNLYRILFVTAQAMMKIVDGGEFDVAKRTVAATKLQDNDEVISVEIIREQKQVILQSAEGYFLRFGLEEVPEKKKSAVGVRGMKLSDKDHVEAVYYTLAAMPDPDIVYKDKHVELQRIKPQHRDSKGTKLRL